MGFLWLHFGENNWDFRVLWELLYFEMNGNATIMPFGLVLALLTDYGCGCVWCNNMCNVCIHFIYMNIHEMDIYSILVNVLMKYFNIHKSKFKKQFYPSLNMQLVSWFF